MTQPNTLPNPSQESARNDHLPPLTDCLLRLLLNLLAPMFLLGSDGDIHLARMAALGTINAYRARNDADLLSIAQIIAFGLATLGSLSLSMADDLSLNMVLRLRGNANACNRSAEQHRRVLRQDHPIPGPHANQPEAPPPTRAAAPQQPPPQPAAPCPSAMTQDQQHLGVWVAAMATVAEEYAAELPNLPPEERKLAEIRVNALNYCIDEFRSGSKAPPPGPPR